MDYRFHQSASHLTDEDLNTKSFSQIDLKRYSDSALAEIAYKIKRIEN